MRTVDLTPTWGEWGNLFYQFALLGEEAVLENLHPDMARGFAFAEALKTIWDSLSEEQLSHAEGVIKTEMKKHGFDLGLTE